MRTSQASPFCPRCQQTLEAEPPERCPRCGQDMPARGWPRDPLLQKEIAGRQYRVIRRLGAGGFGVVYEVETVLGGLRRALKVLKEGRTEDEFSRRRFVNEAQLLERINHPNVARCYSAGTLDESGEPFLLLELIHGLSISQLLKPGGGTEAIPLPPLRAVRLCKQVASGLVAAHGVQILHRDLKPGNVMVTEPGTPGEKVKLLDFGIARFLESEQTSFGGPVGTPSFMAPEQFVAGAELDERLDLWQLGATLFMMLTGRPPYVSPDGSWEGLIAQHRPASEPGPRPSEASPEVGAHPLGEQWSPELEEAWEEGIEAITRVMMSAHRETRRNQSRAEELHQAPAGLIEEPATETLPGSSRPRTA